MSIIKEFPCDIGYEPFLPLAEKWFSARADGVLPAIANFLQAAGDALSDYRMHATIAHNPLSINYIEAGAMLESLYGEKVSGKNLDELYNDWFRKKAYEGYNKMIAERHPFYERRGFSTVIKKLGYYKLQLPFGADAVSESLTYIVPLDADLKNKQDWEEAVRKTPWL